MLNVLQKRRIYDDYVTASPSPKEFERWCDETAAKYGCKVVQVKNVVVQYSELEDLTMRAAKISEGRKLAALAGATQAEAYKTLARGMKASNKRVITNKEGQIVDVISQPDYPSQIRAAVEVLKSQGAYEAQKIEIDMSNDPTKMSDANLSDEIRRLSDQIAGIAQGGAGKESGAGLPVLADELHADPGRAGSGESVQAVPEA
jgi:hypothetical protein